MKSTHPHLILFICLLLFLSANAGRGQEKKSVLNYFPIQLSEQFSFLPAPVLSYKPETSLSMGFSFIGNYLPDPDATEWMSTAQLDLVYTLKRQLIADLDYHLVLFQGTWLFEGSNSVYQYPERYYSQSGNQDSESIEYLRIAFDNQFLRHIQGTWYAGFLHRFQKIKNMEYPSGGLLETEHPTGYSGGVSNGWGLGLVNDHRGNLINPISGGSYIKLQVVAYAGWMGSDFSFTRIDLDLRKYWAMGPKTILALQLAGAFASDGAPFKMQGLLGGSQMMRGYYTGSYWDNCLLAAQAEWRFPIYRAFGMVTFASVGNVAQNPGNLLDQTPLLGYGIGIRYLLDKRSHANLRLDFALGAKSRGIYFGYGESF